MVVKQEYSLPLSPFSQDLLLDLSIQHSLAKPEHATEPFSPGSNIVDLCEQHGFQTSHFLARKNFVGHRCDHLFLVIQGLGLSILNVAFERETLLLLELPD